jgi:hypothetical protein
MTFGHITACEESRSVDTVFLPCSHVRLFPMPRLPLKMENCSANQCLGLWKEPGADCTDGRLWWRALCLLRAADGWNALLQWLCKAVRRPSDDTRPASAAHPAACACGTRC